jgi:hypothetical protein
VIRLLYTEDPSSNGGSEEDRQTRYNPRSKHEDEHLAAFDAAVTEIAARVLPVYGASEAWLERTRAGLIALLGALDERPAAARALVIDSIAWGPAALERRGELLEALAGALEEARTEVKPLAALPRTTGENLVGASLSWVHKRLAREGGPLIELAPSLMGMIVHPYLGSEAAQHELERSHTEIGAVLAGSEQRDSISSSGAVASRAQGPTQGPISRLRRTPS